jgi:hypothetical protein
MATKATKLAGKPKNEGEDRVAQASIPVMPDPPPLRPHAPSPPPEASASTFLYRSMPHAVDPPSPNNMHHLEIGPDYHLVLDPER